LPKDGGQKTNNVISEKIYQSFVWSGRIMSNKRKVFHKVCVIGFAARE